MKPNQFCPACREKYSDWKFANNVICFHIYLERKAKAKKKSKESQ